VMRGIVGRGARLTVMGLVLGTAASLVLTRFLSSLLFEVKPMDAATLIAAATALAAIALIASYLPARRAISTDPLAAIRDE
jgi:putative ABC transport system permease protein